MNNKKPLFLIGFAHFVQDLYPAFIPAVTFYLKAKFDLSYFQITLIMVCCRIPCLLNPLLGIIENRTILRSMIVFTPMLSALFIGLLGLSNSFSAILLFAFLAGVSAQAFHVPSPVIIKRLAHPYAGRGMSIYMMGGELARTLGPFAITWFLLWSSFEKIYILSLLGVLYSLYLFFFLQLDSSYLQNTQEKQGLKSSWLLFYKKKDLIFTIIGATLSKSFTATVLISLIAVYLKESNYSTFLSGNSPAIIAAASVIGVSITGTLSDKIGKKIILLFSAVIAPLLLIGVINASSVITIVPLLFFFGLIGCSTAPVVMSYVQQCAEDIPSFSNGIYMTFNFLVTSLIVLMMGKVSDSFGIKTALFYSALISLSGFLIILFKTPSKE